MKSIIRLSFLIGLTTFSMAAQGDSFQSICSNAERTVSYQVLDSSEFLSVAFNIQARESFGAQSLIQSARAMASVPAMATPVMKSVSDFVAIEVASPIFIEDGTFETNSCDVQAIGDGVIRRHELAVRKVQFQKADGSNFDPNIVALDAGGKTITVDYICKSIEEKTISCLSKPLGY